MAFLNQKYPTFVDLGLMPDAADRGPIINMMVQYNPILEDAAVFPANQGTSHKTTIMTGLPEVTWSRLYKGIPATKGQRQTVVDTLGRAETASEVDTRYVDIYEKAEEKASIQMSEAKGHLEALSQEIAETIFYGDQAADPDKFTGLSPRFNDLSAENGSQIIDAGGTGNDLTSIWLITWSEETVHLIHPKNIPAGLERKNRGEVNKQDAAGDTYYVYREEFAWNLGLSVRNWQYIVRIANIKVSALTKDAATGPNIVELMTKAYYLHVGRRNGVGKTYFYMATVLVEYLDLQSRLEKNANLLLSYSETGPNAKEVVRFREIPIRECDAILETEDRVV